MVVHVLDTVKKIFFHASESFGIAWNKKIRLEEFDGLMEPSRIVDYRGFRLDASTVVDVRESLRPPI